MRFVIPKGWKMLLWAREAQFHSQLDIIVPERMAVTRTMGKPDAVLSLPSPSLTLPLRERWPLSFITHDLPSSLSIILVTSLGGQVIPARCLFLCYGRWVKNKQDFPAWMILWPSVTSWPLLEKGLATSGQQVTVTRGDSCQWTQS